MRSLVPLFSLYGTYLLNLISVDPAEIESGARNSSLTEAWRLLLDYIRP
jgi:hypothetical protein